ncbi:phage tail protein [Clostridium perfringens]|uniref:phage tail protein n=1 Tax=Clostridium perfringens TaxID=1502 RepID=UPI000E116FE9|nr:phage tail protein [Clostridium perfringens]SUY30357.1 KID repeat-containing protein [Clostridium perfringens]
MLKLKDKNKKLVAGLINYKDLCIESTLSTGDKKLSFSLHKEDKFYNLIEEECYIETKTQEYVIKARDVGVDYTRFDCVLNLEELEANIFDRFESVEQTITSSLNLAIVGTGWTVKDNTLKKKRTVRCTNKNALEIVQEIKKTYRVDIVFNTLKREIEVYEHLGEDKGTYFIDSLNLTALQVQSDSYKFATRIIAEGKDGLTFSSINNGKNYVENFQYSKKIKTIYWKDERYTVKESLLEDAKAKLEEISKPFVSYSASILNLAKLNPKYRDILDYKLGDTITLISKNNKVKDKQRIVKILEYPQDHSRDTVELANATLKFEDIQQENQETTSTVNNITVDDGTIDGSTIDGIKVKQIEDFKANVVEVVNLKAINASIDNLHANKADIQDLHAVTAKIGTLEATKANITQLNATNAEISKLNAIKANITDLNTANGKINVLESKTASIDNLLAGNLTANNFKANSIVAGSAIIAENAIGSSQISSLTANKITTGTIDTSLVTVAGPNGRLKILGNRLQIFDDVNNRLFERIMLGINDKNRACLTLRATDGKTVLLTEEGLTKAGITDGFGKADDNSLSALKLDKNSIVRQVNGATETIAGTRIQVGDRTLDIELSTQKNTITEHGKELSSQKATIQALDNAIKLKVDSQTFTQSTTVINNNINKAKEDAINSANNNISSAIDNLKIGGRNLAQLTEPKEYSSFDGRVNDCQMGYAILLDTLNVGDPVTVSYTFSYENLVPVNNHNDYDIWLQGCGDVTEWNLGGFPGGDRLTPKINWGVGNSDSFKVEYTFKLEANAKKNKKWFTSFRMDYIQSGKVSVKEFMVEYGTKATDYTEAPEDLKKYSDDVAKAKSDLAKTEAIANADGKITEEERKRIQQAEANLNTAIAKADKAKADAISEANRVSELKKNEAIKAAGLDATNKANNALNSAKTYVNAEITTVNTHLNKNTSEINILKGKIESKVSQSDIDKSIENIELGGRNLLLNSNKNIEINDNPTELYWAKGYAINCINTLEKGLYTLSVKILADKDYGDLYVALKRQDYSFVCDETLIFNNSNNFKAITFKISKSEVNCFLQVMTGNILKDSKIKVFAKLEKGTKYSDWTPAPEDTDQLIIDNIKTVTDKISTVESNLTQKTNSIEAGVRDLNSITQSITTNVSNINRDLTSKINSNLDAAKSFATDIAIAKANLAKEQAIANADTKKQEAINAASIYATNKANNALNNAKAYTNAEITTVNSKVHNVESNLNILSDKINTKVSQSDIDKSISEMKFNDVNMIINSGRFENINHWGITNGNQNLLIKDKVLVARFNNYASWGLYVMNDSLKNKKLDVTKDYTVVCKLKASRNQTLSFNICDGNSNNYVYSKDLNITTEWEIFKFTFKPASVGNERQFRFITGNLGYDFDLYIDFVKMVEGATSSDVWSPAPEDTNDLVLDNIKVVNTKISDVSSNVTQLRDSVTTQINSINSKTQSIETTLNGKATKQEVTEVNNRVATIKASLDSITQRVSSTESRINTLNGQVANAVTIQQFTEFKQSNKDFQLKISQTTNLHNLVPNGTFAGGLREWICGGEFWNGSYTGYGFSGKICGAVKNKSTSEKFLTSYKAFKVEKNTTYTLNFHYKVEQNVQSMEAFVMLSNTESGDYGQIIKVMQALGGERSDLTNDIPHTFTFNTGNFEWVWLRFDHNGMKQGTNWDEYCWLYISEVAVYKGSVGAVKYLPKSGENYDTTFLFDGMGFKGNFDDGSYAYLGKEGLEWYNAGTGHAYHALTYVTSFDIPIGNPGKAYIKLPAEFTKRRNSLKWTVALRGYYYSTSGDFFPFHIHCTGGRDYIENGLVVCEVQGYCKIQNAQNAGDIQFRPLTAMLIAIA